MSIEVESNQRRMTDNNKSKEQLLKELGALRQRVAELEASKNQLTQYEEILKVFRTKMPIGLFIIEDGWFKFVNDNLRTLLADVSDEIIESYSMKLVYPDDSGIGSRRNDNKPRWKRFGSRANTRQLCFRGGAKFHVGKI